MIQTEIEDPLSEDVLAGKYQPGNTVLVDLKDDHLEINNQEAASVT